MGKIDTPSIAPREEGWVILYAGRAGDSLEPTYRGIIACYGDPLRYDDPELEAKRVALVNEAQEGLDRLLGTPPSTQQPTPGNR